MCNHSYFLDYVLGWKSQPGIKADKGTIVHKVLEILAKIKLAQQGMTYEPCGLETYITDEIANEVNIYKFDIHDICEKVFNYYAKHKAQNWTEQDFKDCCLWVKKVLDFNDGAFSPLKMNIVAPEQQFDIPINEPWSNGLSLKGTIDLITEPSPGIYEIVDWKTGRRLNWATGEEKTHEKLRHDPQLMMYFFATHSIYPKIEQILVTINFINDGGPFTMCYTKDDLPDTLEMLRKRYEEIKACKVPTLNKSWKCTKFCHFGKNSFPKPLVEFRNGQVCKKGQPMTMCEQIHFEMERKGMEKTVKEYTKEGHQLEMYANPGEI